MRDVVSAEFSRVIEIALAEGRPATTLAPFRKQHLETERFQHCHGGDANLRFVITDKGIVPEDFFAPPLVPAVYARRIVDSLCVRSAVIDRRYRMRPPNEPMI